GENHLDLVWIGSASTLQGLEHSKGIWERLGQAFPQLRLRVICDRFPDPFPIPVVPITWEQQTEAQQIAAGQIGISWIPDDVWSQGKCGLKILQYQAAALPVVANPVGSHCEMIRAGESGYLATSPEDWINAIGKLVSDTRLRQRMGLEARKRVVSDY